MDSLNVLSFNCQGLCDMKKRRDVFHYLKTLKYSIYCLQDIHIEEKMQSYVKAEWGYECFFSSYNSNSRGVGIFFRNDFEFKVHNVNRDNEGNYILISFTAFEREFLLVNVYGPNKDSPSFFENLQNIIKSYKNNFVIACGDWNTVLNPEMDYHNYKQVKSSQVKSSLFQKPLQGHMKVQFENKIMNKKKNIQEGA